MKTVQPDRWEFGSEFHWMPTPRRASEETPWSEAGNLYGSGRDALRALLAWGRSERGWRRVWVPSYYCQDVVAVIPPTGVEAAVYRDGPLDAGVGPGPLETGPGDVLLRVNYFGLRAGPPKPAGPMRCEVIEDHSHDPWSGWAWRSDADWCFASLRKTLPVPDGGALWSPAGHPLPPAAPPTSERRSASAEKWAAMALKRFYLSGRPVEKEAFRRLAVDGERRIASGAVSGMPARTKDRVTAFPISAWRRRRKHNHKLMTGSLHGLDWLTVLRAGPGTGASPFSAVLVFESEALRSHVRRRLIEARVYPAVLWPLDEPVLDGIPEGQRDLSRRLLSIPCDMRYDEPDVLRVGSLIRRSGEEFLETNGDPR
jgi:hypothetical protein